MSTEEETVPVTSVDVDVRFNLEQTSLQTIAIGPAAPRAAILIYIDNVSDDPESEESVALKYTIETDDVVGDVDGLSQMLELLVEALKSGEVKPVEDPTDV